MIVSNVKPSNIIALDSKPNNIVALEVKSNITSIDPRNEIYYPVTVTSGQSIGLLLALTYKEGFSIMSPFSP